ncbi:MAG: hybrid sensor histidine kinase/response regulator transcription factor [Phocaeicola sp.]
MEKRFYILVCCLFLLLIPQHAANSSKYLFQQVTLDKGLSSSIPCLTVSRETGYVWVGTRSGIERFDGYQLRKYSQVEATHLIEDRENRIWAISNDTLYYYDEVDDLFIMPTDGSSKVIRAHTICLSADGVIFGDNNELYKYRYEDGLIEPLSLLKSSLYNINVLQMWDDNTLLASGRHRDGVLINIKTGEESSTPFESYNLATSLIDSENNIWISTYNEGVKCYDRDGVLLHAFHTSNSLLKSNVILHLAELNGELWMATDGAGVYVYTCKTGVMTELQRTPGNPNSLPVNTILYLHGDGKNSIWAGSVRGGLINIKEASMKSYTEALPGGAYGLSDKVVLSICEDKDGSVWIGTDGGGINRLNIPNDSFTHFPSTMGDKIASIIDFNNKQLIVSLFNQGVYFFDKIGGKYTPLILVNDSINHRICKQGESVNLLNDKQGNILFLSKYPYKYNLAKRTFTPITYDSNYQIVGLLRTPCNDSTNSLFFDYNRIFRLNENNHLETVFSFSGDTVLNSLSLDENGIIWIGSNKGLSYYSLEDEKVYVIESQLISEVRSLVCDRRGKVWLGASKKLLAYRINEGDFILYDESDGVQINEYLERPRLLSTDGKVYMGGVNGLLTINVDDLLEYEDTPILRLADIWIGGDRVNRSLDEKKVLKIIESEKSLAVRIIAGNNDVFRTPIFRYTLQGLSEDVSYSSNPEMNLNRLPTGSYKLLAACSTRMGGWSPNYEIITLEILPLWYRTEWFRMILFLFFVSTIAGSLYWLTKRNNRKMNRLLMIREQDTYKEKVRLLININHELRTPLTLIHAPLKQLLAKMDVDDLQYPILKSICNQSVRMKNLLDTVLDVHKMEVVESYLHIEEVDLNSWIEQLIADFRSEASVKGVLLNYEPHPSVATLFFDKEKCTTVLTNLLINAVKYTHNYSVITVRISLSENANSIRISITDQGDGLAGVDMDHLFTRFYQGSNSLPGAGIGLSYSKILIEQQGGRIGAYDCENEVGATFWFEIPSDLKVYDKLIRPQSYLNELLLLPSDHEFLDSLSYPRITFDTKELSLLVVDDNKELTDYLYAVFVEKFKQVWVAADGQEAFSLCEKYKPSIVVSDIQMPNMNGYELCKAIKEHFEISHIPIILLTAINNQNSQSFGYKSGADAYLTKPFEMDVLYTLMCSQLKNRERIRGSFSKAGELPLIQESTFSSADEAFLNKLNEFVLDNLNNEQLGVPLLSQEMAVSRSSLYNKLKALTGMGVNDYITKFRIEEAKRLLMNNELSINEISDTTGFSTSRYFSTVFKQHTGITPTQFKKKKGII